MAGEPGKEAISVAIVGHGEAGKTKLVRRFTDNTFTDKHIPTTLMDIQSREFANCKFQLFDLSPYENKMPSTMSLKMPQVKIALVCYAINDAETFETAKQIVNDITQKINPERGTPLKVILVGTKSDLKKERQVRKLDTDAFANDKGISHIECSAKDDTNVMGIFEKAASLMEIKSLGASIDDDISAPKPDEPKPGEPPQCRIL